MDSIIDDTTLTSSGSPMVKMEEPDLVEVDEDDVNMASNTVSFHEYEKIHEIDGGEFQFFSSSEQGARPKQYSNVIVDESPLQNQMEKNKECKFFYGVYYFTKFLSRSILFVTS